MDLLHENAREESLDVLFDKIWFILQDVCVWHSAEQTVTSRNLKGFFFFVLAAAAVHNLIFTHLIYVKEVKFGSQMKCFAH